MVLKKIHGNRDYETEMSSIQTAQTSFQVLNKPLRLVSMKLIQYDPI